MSDAGREASSPDDDGVLLDVLGILEGVDKASLRGDVNYSWDYLRHYAHAFRKYRDEAINVLEIGVYLGASLNLWLRYFSRATIIGVDNNPECARLSRGRAQVKIGSQDDKEFMTEIATAYPPSIVIDDGSHFAQHMIRSFEILFPLMVPGGTYVIEDLAFHFAINGAEVVAVHPLPGHPSEPVFGYFSRLMGAKAAHVTTLRGASDDMNRLYEAIDSICIVGGALLIRKKAARELDRYVATFEETLRSRAAYGRSHYCYVASRYADFLTTYHYKLDRAVQLLKELVALEPDNRLTQKLLYKALVSSGRLEEAAKLRVNMAAVTDEDAPRMLVPMPEHVHYPH
jgi:hypothetical protein